MSGLMYLGIGCGGDKGNGITDTIGGDDLKFEIVGSTNGNVKCEVEDLKVSCELVGGVVGIQESTMTLKVSNDAGSKETTFRIRLTA